MSNAQLDIVQWSIIGFGALLCLWISKLPTVMPQEGQAMSRTKRPFDALTILIDIVFVAFISALIIAILLAVVGETVEHFVP